MLAPAQLSLGAYAGLDDDRTWAVSLPRFGAFVEWAPSSEAIHRFRAQAFTQPPVVHRSQAGNTWHEVRMERRGAGIGGKWPLGCAWCPRGLYRGFYLLAGAEWMRRYVAERTGDDRGTPVRSGSRQADRYGTSIGMGGEYNFTWGCPFAELHLASAFATDDPLDRFVFPSDVGVCMGFRYCWRSRRPVVHRHT